MNHLNEIVSDLTARDMLPEPWRSAYDQAVINGRAALASIAMAIESAIPSSDRVRLRPQTYDRAMRVSRQHVASLAQGGPGVAADGTLKAALDAYVIWIATMQWICDDCAAKTAAGQSGEAAELRH